VLGGGGVMVGEMVFGSEVADALSKRSPMVRLVVGEAALLVGG
jgi:hypothetical protein